MSLRVGSAWLFARGAATWAVLANDSRELGIAQFLFANFNIDMPGERGSGLQPRCKPVRLCIRQRAEGCRCGF